MKTLLMKIFMIVAAALCMFEGILLLAVGLGRLSPEKFSSLYNRLIETPRALPTISGIGIFFVLLGFILLVVSSRTKPAPKMITVNKDDKVLRIPQQTIKSFIKQIIEQNPYARDISIELETKEEFTDIKVSTAFNGVPSVRQELNRIEEVLKNEIESVFDWKDFRFNFQLRGVSVDPNKKYFSSKDKKPDQVTKGELRAEEPEVEESEVGDAGIEESEKESAPAIKDKSKLKDKPKDKTLFSKMLWGK